MALIDFLGVRLMAMSLLPLKVFSFHSFFPLSFSHFFLSFLIKRNWFMGQQMEDTQFIRVILKLLS